MGTKRSDSLHNFAMPCGWGKKSHFRCVSVNPNGQITHFGHLAVATDSGGSDHRHHNQIQQRRTAGDADGERGNGSSSGSPKLSPPGPPETDDGRRISSDDGDGVSSAREKVMLDPPVAADKIKDGLEEGEASVPQPQLPNPAAESREGNTHCPWNLRTRRASCKATTSRIVSGRNDTAPVPAAGKGLSADAPRTDSGVPHIRAATAASARKPPIHRSNGGRTAAGIEKMERPKFSATLSKREIEEDFLEMTGRRPPRRPKKRPKVVQEQLNDLFPAFLLKEVTPDMYKVLAAAP